MRFGANYTPRQGWFHAWLDLDLAQTRRDFDTLRSLGLDHIRLFPLWPLLQPNRTLIRSAALEDVRAVVRVAAEAGLDVVVDALQGHLSSFDFLPAWVSSWHRRNLFTDPEVVSGQRALIEALGQTLAGEPNAIGLSVGNEIIQFAAPRHPYRHHLTPPQAAEWLHQLLQAAQSSWPGGLHTHSHDDDLFFDPDHPFTPEHAVTLGEVTTVHSWIFVALGNHLGADHPGLAWFARYLCELARAWSPDPDRPVWLQEVGAPLTHLGESSAAGFVRETVANLAGFEPLWAVTWWCSHDVSRSLADFPELEHTLGLIDEHGRVKATGRALAEAITDWSPAGSASGAAPMVFDGTNLARRDTRPTSPFFDQWLDRALGGRPPRLARTDS